MKLDQAFPSKYLSAADLQGRALTLEISHVNEERIGDENKLVLYFHNKTKGFVLNKTNATTIASLLNSDDTDDWGGQKIIIRPDKTQFQGKVVDCIRVSVEAPRQAAKARPLPVEEGPVDYSELEESPF